MAGVSKSCYQYKPMRPSEILDSEKHVTKIVNVLKGKYINPFDIGLEDLYNLSSGETVEETAANNILNVKKDGKKLYDEFIKSRPFVFSTSLDFMNSSGRSCTMNS